MRTRWILGLSILFFAAGAAAGERTVRFTGEDLSDEHLGILVGGDDDRKHVAVLSPRFHYGMTLPYGEWEFSRTEDSLLTGHSGLVNLTLQGFRSDETPEAHLAARRKRLETTPAGKGIRKMAIVSSGGQKVLRNEVDAGAFAKEFEGATIVHYFAAKAWKNELFVLHLSVVVPPGGRKDFEDERYLGYLTRGFRVDFDR